MTRAGRLHAAVARYGRVNPSPDDILSVAWPSYESGDLEHIRGYHRDFSEVMRMVLALEDVQQCKGCGARLTGENRNRRYCRSESCRRLAAIHKQHKLATPRPTTSEAEVRRIVELYVGRQMSVLDVSAATGRSPTAIYNALKRAGVERRSYKIKGRAYTQRNQPARRTA